MSTVLDERSESTHSTPSTPNSPAPSRTTSGRTLVLVGSLLAVAVMLALPIRSWVGQQAHLGELAADIEAAQQRVDDLDEQRSRWQEPAYVERQARLRLNMVRPGEMGLIVLDPDLEPDVARSDDSRTDNWYGRLWESTGNPARAGQPRDGQTQDTETQDSPDDGESAG